MSIAILEEYLMKNKHFLLSFIIIICFSFLITSCSNKKALKPDTPTNTAMVMESFLKAGDYESFNKLFTDDKKNAISLEQFNDLKKLNYFVSNGNKKK